MAELFSHSETLHAHRRDAGNPYPAPRSPLASYVLDQLPADLTAVTRSQSTYEELAAKQCRMLRTLGDDTPPADDASARLVQLDLLFMRGNLPEAGHQPGTYRLRMRARGRDAGHDVPLDTDGEPLYFQAVLVGPADYYDYKLEK
ncbi:hypothetical protein CP981_00095 [Streptomyces platensis]|nr:hypothetical protein [Streptomyces platensis]QEV50302.1 hypothetical protein CP981_00095 [Streptomyces platensis]